MSTTAPITQEGPWHTVGVLLLPARKQMEVGAAPRPLGPCARGLALASCGAHPFREKLGASVSSSPRDRTHSARCTA